MVADWIEGVVQRYYNGVDVVYLLQNVIEFESNSIFGVSMRFKGDKPEWSYHLSDISYQLSAISCPVPYHLSPVSCPLCPSILPPHPRVLMYD